MKLALAQTNIFWEDKEANYLKAEKWLFQAAMQQADFIFFPEMSFTGFSMAVEKIGERERETLEFLKVQAKKYHINIGAGWVKLAERKGENHYTLINRQGEIALDYVKMHPFSYSGEDQHYKAGNQYQVVAMEEVPLTTFICYDLRFPLSFWKASEKAHLIIVPANWPKRRIEQWKILLRARAIENQVYIAAINCVGNVGKVEYSGNSCFINPKGNMIAEVEDKEELIVVDWEDDVELFREKFPVHNDRRSEER